MFLVSVSTAYPMHDQPVIKMLGLTGCVLELECPYHLGIANNSIDPYHYVWLYANNSDVEIPGSGRRRTFSVDVNQDSTALYSCAINMRRCSYPECTNMRALPLFSDRVKFRITKAGRCLNLICVHSPHTLCQLVQSLFPW